MAIRFIQGLDKTLNIIDRLLKYFCGLLMLFIVFSISFSIIMRYFFNQTFAWTVEVSEYIMIFIAFLTIAWTLRNDGHVKIEVLTNKMSPKMQQAMNFFVYFLSAIVFFIIFWFSMLAVIDMFTRNIVALQTLAVPRFIIMLPISIGSLLFSLRSLLKLFDPSLLQNRDI